MGRLQRPVRDSVPPTGGCGVTLRDVLIIGAGFLGTALAERLARDRVNVHLLSPRVVTFRGSAITTYAGKMDDERLLETIVSRCDTVVHAASASTPGSTRDAPVAELQQNILPTLRLLNVLQGRPGVHLIYLSSGGCVYGDPLHTPITESDALKPKSYHGAGKVAVEAFLHAFRVRTPGKHPVTVLRPSNLYGPGQPARDGFGVIRTILEKMKTGEQMEIWGDGETVRDFLYIDDLVEVCARVVDRPQDSETYNVGSGQSYSINRLIELAQQVCAKPLRVHHRPGRHSDVRAVVLDYGLVRKTLDWVPMVSLEDGIARTWRWLNRS